MYLFTNIIVFYSAISNLTDTLPPPSAFCNPDGLSIAPILVYCDFHCITV